MMDLAQEFDRTIGAAIGRGLRPGPWRAEIEQRFIAARFAGDTAACRKILGEWRARVAAAEEESRAAAEAKRQAARDAERRDAAARLTPRAVVEAIERGGWHRLSLRRDGALVISGGAPEDEVLREALLQHAEAIRALIRARARRLVLIPAP